MTDPFYAGCWPAKPIDAVTAKRYTRLCPQWLRNFLLFASVSTALIGAAMNITNPQVQCQRDPSPAGCFQNALCNGYACDATSGACYQCALSTYNLNVYPGMSVKRAAVTSRPAKHWLNTNFSVRQQVCACRTARTLPDLLYSGVRRSQITSLNRSYTHTVGLITSIGVCGCTMLFSPPTIKRTDDDVALASHVEHA
jgi:hypothetical protein